MRHVVGILVANRPALSVHSSVTGLHHHLRLTVTVKVIHHELSVVRPGTDVASEVNSPESASVQFVAVEEHIASISVVGIVVGVRGGPLEDNLILTVTVHVSHRTVVGTVPVLMAVGCLSCRRHVERDTQVTARSVGFQRKPSVLTVRLPAVVHCPHLIFSPLGTGHLHERGGRDRFFVQPFSVPVDIEACSRRVFLQITPRDTDTVTPAGSAYSQSTVQVLTLHTLEVIPGLSVQADRQTHQRQTNKFSHAIH